MPKKSCAKKESIMECEKIDCIGINFNNAAQKQ